MHFSSPSLSTGRQAQDGVFRCDLNKELVFTALRRLYGENIYSGKREVKMILNGNGSMDGTNRANVKAGLPVLIVLKKDQHSGKLTEGIVKDVLTKSGTHPHGIKVRLESGEIGRVKKIL